jgi:hypothetical protein
MSSIKLKGSSSGDVTITVPAAAGTNTVTIPAVQVTLPLSNLDHVTNRPNAKPLLLMVICMWHKEATSVTGVTGTAYQTVVIDLDLNGYLGTWTITQAHDVPTGSGFTHSLKV